MVRVSLIILNRDGEDLLDDCLHSVKQQTFTDFEVIFVDNGSTDGSLDRVQKLLPETKCVALKENTGFARGNNLGMEQAEGDFVVLLNNDTQLDERFLEELVRVAESDSRVGMVAPKILNFFERRRIDSVGGLIICRDGLAQGRGRGEQDEGQYDELREILLPSGCAALYRREMLAEIGMFDEEFFIYCEDTDLGLRARWAGWKALSAPRAVVYHKYSGFSGAYSPFKLYLVERNHFLLAAKNFPCWWLVQLPLWSICRYLLMAAAVFSGKGKGAAGQTGALLKAFLRGHLAALWRAPAALLRRARPARLRGTEFARLLRRHHLSLKHMIFNE
jgi:GT2 family glycosyltransferase